MYQDTSTVTGFAADFGGDVVLQKTAITGLGVADQVQIATNGVVTGKSPVISGLKVGDITWVPGFGLITKTLDDPDPNKALVPYTGD